MYQCQRLLLVKRVRVDYIKDKDTGETVQMKVSEQLKQLRQQRQWNQDRVAERIHVSRQTVSNWENDKTLPDIQSLLLLADLYQVTLDDLVRGELNMVEFKRTKRLLIGYSIGIGAAVLVFLLACFLQVRVPAYTGWWRLMGSIALIFQAYFSVKDWRLSKQKNIFTMAEIMHYLKTGQLRPSTHRRRRIILESVLAALLGAVLGGGFAWLVF